VAQLTLSWGTTPLSARSGVDSLETVSNLVDQARDLGHVRSGELVAVLAGAGGGVAAKDRATDLLHLVRVP
jgi:hypothetical protein